MHRQYRNCTYAMKRKSEASKEAYGNKLTDLSSEMCDQRIIANPLITLHLPPEKSAVANTLALELYVYWKPEASCVGCDDANTVLSNHLTERSQHDRTNIIQRA